MHTRCNQYQDGPTEVIRWIVYRVVVLDCGPDHPKHEVLRTRDFELAEDCARAIHEKTGDPVEIETCSDYPYGYDFNCTN